MFVLIDSVLVRYDTIQWYITITVIPCLTVKNQSSIAKPSNYLGPAVDGLPAPCKIILLCACNKNQVYTSSTVSLYNNWFMGHGKLAANHVTAIANFWTLHIVAKHGSYLHGKQVKDYIEFYICTLHASRRSLICMYTAPKWIHRWAHCQKLGQRPTNDCYPLSAVLAYLIVLTTSSLVIRLIACKPSL